MVRQSDDSRPPANQLQAKIGELSNGQVLAPKDISFPRATFYKGGYDSCRDIVHVSDTRPTRTNKNGIRSSEVHQVARGDEGRVRRAVNFGRIDDDNGHTAGQRPSALGLRIALRDGILEFWIV